MDPATFAVFLGLGGDEKVAEIEAALQAQLDEQHAPTKAQGQL